jgi:hypothetical protein
MIQESNIDVDDKEMLEKEKKLNNAEYDSCQQMLQRLTIGTEPKQQQVELLTLSSLRQEAADTAAVKKPLAENRRMLLQQSLALLSLPQ